MPRRLPFPHNWRATLVIADLALVPVVILAELLGLLLQRVGDGFRLAVRVINQALLIDSAIDTVGKFRTS